MITSREQATPVAPDADYVRLYPKVDGRWYFMAANGTEIPMRSLTTGLLADGSEPLTANWDAGPFEITALRFHSDEATLSPFTVVSTALVVNLNADLLDGQEGSYYASVTYVDNSIVGLFDDKGNYDAATNTPDLDVSPSGVLKGDVYTVSVAGLFFTENVEVGDVIRALQDSPTLLAHWAITQTNLDAASVKTLYESNTDTNEFSDAEQTKLAGIATGAGTTFEWTIFVETVADQDYVLTFDAPYPGTIDTLRTKTEAGTCTITGKIEATALGGTANSASTTATEQAHSSANTVAKGDKILVTASANSGATSLEITFYGTRT